MHQAARFWPGALWVLVAALVLPFTAFGTVDQGAWLQWGLNAQHTGASAVLGQPLNQTLFEIEYDPLVPQEQAASNGALATHYQVPLVDNDGAIYMEFKSGFFDPNTKVFATQIWSEKRLWRENGQLQVQWSYDTDWKAPGSLNDFWEPVFHPVIVDQFIYLPGAGGSIWQLQKGTGAVVTRINPFGSTVNPSIFTASPLSADAQGNVYYNAIQLTAPNVGFYAADVVDSWLVKIAPNGTVKTTSYQTLVPNPPTTCLGQFPGDQLPWPPAPDAVPPSIPCGTVRVAMNAAPAIGSDGTIYTVARMHLSSRDSWLVATHADLTPRWAASLQDRLHDGCRDLATQPGVMPLSGTPGGCRVGAPVGVDPAINRPGGGIVLDHSSATVVVAPDGVLYGALNRYNYFQGHTMKFDFQGQYVAAFGFGWDSTPAIYVHDGTYSVIVKNNHYSGLGSYCDNPAVCPSDRSSSNPASPEGYFVSQLTANLTLEWSFQNTNTESCMRNSDGSLTCVSDHPASFEWCVNAPAVDQAGVVYANSEDGYLYAINQGGTLKQRIFQRLALGAAYTPASIGPDGAIYSQNAGHLFIVGDVPTPTPTTTATASPSSTPTLSTTSTSTVTPTPSNTPTGTSTVTVTGTSTSSPIATSTATPTLGQSSTPTVTATPTLSRTPIPTPTPSISPTSNGQSGSELQGQVAYQGRGAEPPASRMQQIVVTFFQGDSVRLQATPVTSSSGSFSVPVAIPGPYDVRVKHALSLSQQWNGVSFPAGIPVGLNFGVLLTGDSNGDDQIDIVDFSLLRSAFGTPQNCGLVVTNPLPCADFDGSGFVDIADFSLLRANFGRVGPILLP